MPVGDMSLRQPRTLTPTATDLCTEGFRLAAGRVPKTEELDRALLFWIEDILQEIWQFETHQDITRFKALENSATLLLVKGQRRYDLPEDFHRPIGMTLLRGTRAGTVNTATADGGTTLVAKNTGGLLNYSFTNNYALSGRYLVISSGVAEGNMRGFVSATSSSAPVLHTIVVDDAWTTPELPAANDTFFIAEEAGQWVDEDMRDHLDGIGARVGTGRPFSFNQFDNEMELDVAPDSTTHALLIRYWSNPLKINKESRVMQKILTDWRSAITRGLAWKTAMAIDDSRVLQFKRDFEESRLAVVEHEYDRGPVFAGFRPAGSYGTRMGGWR